MSNGVAHFYFTLLPYLTYRGARVSSAMTLLSVGLVCLWLYGVKRISSRILLLVIPCAWLITFNLIVDGLSPQSFHGVDEVIDLSISDPKVLGDELNLLETLGSGLIFVTYLLCCLRWLAVSKDRVIDHVALQPCDENRVKYNPPKRWPSYLLIYWVISTPLAIHFWSTLSVLPQPLKSKEDLDLWIQLLFSITIMPIALGVALVLFRYRPIHEEFTHQYHGLSPHRRWRRQAWLLALFGGAIFCLSTFSL